MIHYKDKLSKFVGASVLWHCWPSYRKGIWPVQNFAGSLGELWRPAL